MNESTPPGGDPFELLKKLWAPTGLPVPGMVVPTLDPSEINKRIDDLKRVENWMTVNLNVLRMSIQSLEMQKATLAAMAAAISDVKPAAGKADAAKSESGEAGAAGASMPSLADAWWQMFQQMAATAASQGTKPQTAPPGNTEPHPDAKSGAPKGKKGG